VNWGVFDGVPAWAAPPAAVAAVFAVFGLVWATTVVVNGVRRVVASGGWAHAAMVAAVVALAVGLQQLTCSTADGGQLLPGWAAAAVSALGGAGAVLLANYASVYAGGGKK
jgi:hypothetical protein